MASKRPRRVFDYMLPPYASHPLDVELIRRLSQAKTETDAESIFEQMRLRYGRLRQFQGTVKQYVARLWSTKEVEHGKD